MIGYSGQGKNSQPTEKGFNQSFEFQTESFEKLKNITSQIGQSFINFLTRPPEPKVCQKSDRAGNTWWSVYDPSTGRSSNLSSEMEVRMWLEERRYHARRF